MGLLKMSCRRICWTRPSHVIPASHWYWWRMRRGRFQSLGQCLRWWARIQMFSHWTWCNAACLPESLRAQLCAKSWIGNLALFSRSVECRTVSNALEKSKARRWTYGYSWRSLVSCESDLSKRMWLIRLAWRRTVSEQMTASWVVKYWVKIVLHHNLFHYSGQDGGDWYWSVFSTRLPFCYFRNRCNYTSFPLPRNLRSCKW